MGEWWEQAYPGGPMVAAKGLPRVLDADARPVDGSDVEAYKRTVSRAGRWHWQAFDQQYSRAFAYGKSGGNVGESGISGIQRQQKLEPTGLVDPRTFNTLRSIRIPDGLAHAGEMAMDARSVELLNAAWYRFAAPPAASVGSAQARLEQAVSQLGVKEDPPNSNQCAYTDWYGMTGPWCAMFVSWADQTGARPSASFLCGASYAYVPYILNDARLGLNGLAITSSPEPGDLVCYDWGWDGEYDHIGIVETPADAAGEFVAIEGNTSTTDQSNGGEVMRRTRNQYAQGTVFVRVAE
jgi:hypothetical protein